jgi:hypothetical protein
MKKLYILLLAAIFFSQFTHAQGTVNALTDFEFDQIKINDIPIGNVIDTRGDYTKLKAMFGDDLQYKSNADDLPTFGIKFWNNKLMMRFEEEDYILTYFNLYYPSTLTIKGKKVKVGDDVSALGLVFVFTDPRDGEEYVFYHDERTHTAGITIKINPTTKKIKEIHYILF